MALQGGARARRGRGKAFVRGKRSRFRSRADSCRSGVRQNSWRQYRSCGFYFFQVESGLFCEVFTPRLHNAFVGVEAKTAVGGHKIQRRIRVAGAASGSIRALIGCSPLPGHGRVGLAQRNHSSHNMRSGKHRPARHGMMAMPVPCPVSRAVSTSAYMTCRDTAANRLVLVVLSIVC